MATFTDQRDDETVEEEEFDTLETPEEQPQEQPQEADDDIPDKYRGKDLKDIVRMHQEAEKLLGRQSQEVGELRKTFDDYIKTQLAKEEQAHASTTDTQPVDFFEDPQKAVETAIANHPKIKEAETVAQQLKMQEAMAKLKSSHPDFEQVVMNEDFLGWVQKSKFRTDLLRKADREYDYEAADELLSSWKERQSVVNQTAQTEQQSRKDSVKKASTGNTKGSAEAPSRKVYRRADIIKLMQTDPDRYMQLAEEIRLAYAEGRVR
jgi:predicted FMN-binding regulatory protein PaiB